MEEVLFPARLKAWNCGFNEAIMQNKGSPGALSVHEKMCRGVLRNNNDVMGWSFMM